MTEEGVLRYVLFEGTGDSFPVHVVEMRTGLAHPVNLIRPSMIVCGRAGFPFGGAVQDLQRTFELSILITWSGSPSTPSQWIHTADRVSLIPITTAPVMLHHSMVAF
jgi:hypothetical protein